MSETAASVLAPIVAAASKKAATTSSSSSLSFLLFIGVIAVLGFMFYRSQQRKARAQRELSSGIDVGDEIMTIGGIVGTVVEIDDERVTIETGIDRRHPTTASGTPQRVHLVRSAIGRKIVAAPPGDDSVTDAELVRHDGEDES